MKKLGAFAQILIAVVIATALVASVFTGCILKLRKPDFTFMVISDVHVFLEEQVGDRNSEAYKAFDAKKAGKLEHMSECVFRSAVDAIIARKPNALLISGDLADVHAIDEHLLIARELKRVEDAGITVYIVPGNHDTADNETVSFATGIETSIEGAELDDFMRIQYEFGLDKAIAREPNSASYVADLNENFRLIAIDADGSQKSDEKTRKLLAWIVEQTEKCVADGKVPIGIMHFPVLGHYGSFLGDLSLGDTNVRLKDEFRDALIAAGMSYIFTGHLHSSDITSYTDSNGTLYDIETAALANYPSPMRVISCTKDKMVMDTEYLTKINPDYLPAFITGAEREYILSDYQGYAGDYLCKDFVQFLFADLFPEALPSVMDIFGLDEDDPEVVELIQDTIQLLDKFAFLPLYTKDEKNGGTSLQRICSQYGITIPNSDYKGIADLMLRGIAAANFKGDENITSTSTEGQLFRYSLYSAFYMLADFDIFGRMHHINADIADIDLTPAMSRLFTKGELDVVENELISGIISSLPLILDNAYLSLLAGMSSQEAVDTIKVFSEMEILGLKPLKYVSAEDGTLLIGKLLDDILFGSVGMGVIKDDNPPDNRIIFDIATSTWSA